jgi:hypothetical protein
MTSAAKAASQNKALNAALEALRHPQPLQRSSFSAACWVVKTLFTTTIISHAGKPAIKQVHNFRVAVIQTQTRS